MSGAFAEEKSASSTSGIWKEIRGTQTFLYHLPKIPKSRALFSPLFHVDLRIEGRGSSANIHPPPVSTEGDPHPDMQVFPRLLPSRKYSCNYRAVPLSAESPSISPRDRPVLGGGCGRAAAPQQGEAPAALQRPGFPLKHQPSTCKGRGLKCSLSGRVWQQSKVKVTLLPNLNSTVVLELLKLADILLFQSKENFFFSFSQKAGGVSPTSATCHTQQLCH